jgi:AcrR family transcriptional regulator
MSTRAQRRRQTEERILAAARDQFAGVGYDRATIRAVAAAAQVDPALVMQYFGSKEALFRTAVPSPTGDEPLELGPERLAELVLDAVRLKLDEPPAGSLALLRSMLTHPEATARMRTDTTRQVHQFATALPDDDAELRAALLIAATLGLSVARHLLDLDTLREASPEQIVALLRPAFHALTGT